MCFVFFFFFEVGEGDCRRDRVGPRWTVMTHHSCQLSASPVYIFLFVAL